RHWLNLAAAAGHAQAVDRLANLYLHGPGSDRDPERALRLLERLAEAGFKRASWEVGYLKSTLDEIIDPVGAVTAFARAAALGYGPAFYSLGLRFAHGAGVDTDRAFGHALLFWADRCGVADARAAADTLQPSGAMSQAASKWFSVLQRVDSEVQPLRDQQVSPGNSIAHSRLDILDQIERHFADLGHPALSFQGGRLVATGKSDTPYRARPKPMQWIDSQPRVARIRDFITREERTQIISMVSGALVPPEHYTGGAANSTENVFFNGTGMYFSALTADVMVRAIEYRIAQTTGLDMRGFEPSSIIGYAPGQEYQPHVDYFNEQELATSAKSPISIKGQRIVTFLICLEAPESGGETLYPKADLKVAHARDDAMLHYNTLPDGQPDEMSLHHGLPIERGRKLILRTAIRAFMPATT
ncbi:MAG: hypothetical protein ABR550_07920, partial [Wenzhouxiangellaceae bacterium]